MKIGFIGTGNMGSAILKGVLNSGLSSKNVYIYDLDIEKCKSLQSIYNINICDNYESLISASDLLIFAIKPDVILNVISETRSYINLYKPIVVSIAAGVELDSISNIINNPEIGIVRIMPNINAEINLSTSAYCYRNLEEESVNKVLDLFRKIGTVFYIPENKFNIFTAIAGCSPAYIYLFLDSLAKGAQKMGLNKKEALDIAIDTLIGSAKMLKHSKKHPWELIDAVCSPGGTTIEGICTLEENNFQQAVVKAVENSIKKDILLKKKS
ncbi:pyrroline-5-carboxylate reductase [[Clostridium] colinum]|uniref:pyrroline-5-carboxylate reductase n=1 Tax=[Clostridium] colinum TaxID=36835 RepID=UPI002024CD4F|nr:pyrroline-5-carboxylate reductase [[Clostridium] colinum]